MACSTIDLQFQCHLHSTVLACHLPKLHTPSAAVDIRAIAPQGPLLKSQRLPSLTYMKSNCKERCSRKAYHKMRSTKQAQNGEGGAQQTGWAIVGRLWVMGEGATAAAACADENKGTVLLVWVATG